MKTKILAVAGIFLASVSLLAVGPGRGMNQSSFTTFDVNGDGVITQQEFMDVRAEKQAARSAQGYPMRNAANAPTFESIDTNGDGKITQTEFSNFRATRMRGRGQGMNR
ncbi:EF-hand domain-containing protein [Sulfurimonas sediminis]|uniref:EF-hand domain-containing protein n=1 Tax=Sulfurimonas sediminis TaxID=2590020 RepID=A0A7M1AZE9_9BACT|nr:EF-hand domain-containing protein [Sulfurimonas sediminis]QOP42831.1 EF-hand domain-containing protein [Sulfurimonas sediminis]